MSRNPLLATPFMPAEYERTLEPLNDMVAIEPTDLAHEDPRQRMLKNLQVIMGNTGYVKQEVAQRPETIESEDDLEYSLQIGSLGSVIRDRTLQMMMQGVAIAAGEATADNDAESAERANKMGEEIIMGRARRGITDLLCGSALLFDTAGHSEEAAVWERTQAAHSRRRMDSPNISEKNWTELTELTDKAFEQPITEPKPPIKLGKSKAVNIFRVVRFMRKQMKAVEGSGLNGTLDMMDMMYQSQASGGTEPLNLDEETISRTLSTLNKTMRRVRNAADVDPSISTDTSARFMAYILPQLSPACAVKTERGAFSRISEEITSLQIDT